MSLSGHVTELALGDLLQVTAMQQRTCCIAIDDPVADGEIYFVSGEVTHARFGELHGNQAVYALLARETARFKLKPGVMNPARTVSQGWQELMMEGARLRDEGAVPQPQNARRRSQLLGLLGWGSSLGSWTRSWLALGALLGLLLTGALYGWLTRPTKSVVPARVTESAAVALEQAAVVDGADLQGAGDARPILVSSQPPRLPDIDLALSPTVVCRVLIGVDGAVQEAKVYRSRLELAAFEDAALDAVRTYRFQPARRDGVVVAAWINVPVSFERAPAAGQLRLQIKGSDTIGGALGPALAEGFTAQRGRAAVEVRVEALGSSTAFMGLFDGSADIGAASRPVRPEELSRAEELGIQLREFAIGYDGIAIVVHPSNPLSELTLEQASAIFRGEIRNWAAFGGEPAPIRVLSRPSYSGTHDFFRDKVLHKGAVGDAAAEGEQAKGFGQETEFIEKTEAILAEVNADPTAISYVGLGWLGEGVRAVRLALGAGMAAVVPESKSVRDGSYPVYRPLLMYTRGQPKGAVAQFLRYVFSPAGQQLVEQHGFVASDVAVDIPDGPVSEQTPEPHVVRVFFPSGSAVLDAADRQVLAQVAAELREKGGRAVLVGAADSVGDPAGNLSLVARRTQHVESYLQSAGVLRERIQVEGGADSRPLATNTSEDGRRANRRVDVYIVPE